MLSSLEGLTIETSAIDNYASFIMFSLSKVCFCYSHSMASDMFQERLCLVF